MITTRFFKILARIKLSPSSWELVISRYGAFHEISFKAFSEWQPAEYMHSLVRYDPFEHYSRVNYPSINGQASDLHGSRVPCDVQPLATLRRHLDHARDLCLRGFVWETPQRFRSAFCPRAQRDTPTTVLIVIKGSKVLSRLGKLIPV